MEEIPHIDEDDLDLESRILNLENRRIRLENLDEKEDAQRRMAWFCIFGMIFYPVSVILAVWLDIYVAAEILGDMASTYFVSVAAIVAAFYGKEAYLRRSERD
jgi:hypothetical protein